MTCFDSFLVEIYTFSSTSSKYCVWHTKKYSFMTGATKWLLAVVCERFVQMYGCLRLRAYGFCMLEWDRIRMVNV